MAYARSGHVVAVFLQVRAVPGHAVPGATLLCAFPHIRGGRAVSAAKTNL
jgi:hypothetical protein